MSESVTPAVGTIHLHKQGHVGTIVFDNQAKFNAMNYDMWVGLPKLIQQCVDDHDIRMIVLTGAGEKAFVSGADISQFGERRSGGDAAEEYNRATEAAYSSVRDCPKPTLAKIRGICMGGGLGLALNCDIRLCSSDSKFRMPAGRLGLGYAFAGIKRFTEVVGFAHTPDLFFSARIFGPADAHHMGLVKQVLEVDQFETGVQAYVQQVCENAPLTLAASKRALLELRKNPEDRDLELVYHLIGSIEDDGYLRRELRSIVNDLAFNENIMTTEAHLERLLIKIQNFDPPGIAARDLQECLLLQLYKKDYGDKIFAISWRLKRELGFTVRQHKGLVKWNDDADYKRDEEWLPDEFKNRYHYEEQIHLDFYNEAQMTMFVLKYLNT